eukprot:GHVO01056560.1.p1 GENE.GHVO01056560.1~~GHVO01056560.1.p1  ORF type:complete len:145 (+),score=13.32 GHVO01056560.1:372-806(+)
MYHPACRDFRHDWRRVFGPEAYDAERPEGALYTPLAEVVEAHPDPSEAGWMVAKIRRDLRQLANTMNGAYNRAALNPLLRARRLGWDLDGRVWRNEALGFSLRFSDGSWTSDGFDLDPDLAQAPLEAILARLTGPPTGPATTPG